MAVLPKSRGQTAQLRHPPGIAPRHVSSNQPSRQISSTRHVSRSRPLDNDDPNDDVLGDTAIHFHENKRTILSNFEEWIRLSTDNKITAKNSWLFDLINYFHDLNVIKDGDAINFQRASATLDGCVKIYSSRVDSAQAETARLLTGLAHRASNGNSDDPAEDADPENAMVGDASNGELIRKRRRFNRTVESTIVAFDLIRAKKSTRSWPLIQF